VAVQLNPEWGRIRAATGAHKDLGEYLKSKDILVYWGGAGSFLGELWDHWTEAVPAGGGG
jgi:hypothetical protein